MTKHWTFEDSELANNFGDHVRGQLPWYDLATGLVRCIAENYLTEGGVMYDIGASDGNITSACRDLIKERSIHAISIEPSLEMCKVWQGEGELVNNFAEHYDFKCFDLCVCFLTLMFIKPSVRTILLNRLKEKMNAGSAIVIVDKFVGFGGYKSIVLDRMTLRQKLASGETAENIIAKELSLSGVQRPFANLFDSKDQFFQIGNFKGYLITNE